MDSLPEINLDTAKTTAQRASSSLKSAGSLVAKQAERTKLASITLPRAYAELGKAIYKEASRRGEFAELFNAVDELLAQRKRTHEATQTRALGSGFAGKAKKVAADAADLARIKAIDLQALKAYAKLGDICYQTHGSKAGPVEAVQPIIKAIARQEELDRDLAAIDEDSKGKVVTPKRIALAFGLVITLAVVAALFDETKHLDSDTSPGIDGRTEATNEPSLSDPPVTRSFWGPTQLAYKKRIDLCDNPDKYKNTEMKMEVKYRGGGIRQGGKLTNIRCTVFYGDGSFEMAFVIPSDVSQPRIEPGQYLWVTFVFSGSVDSPSRVTAISRK